MTVVFGGSPCRWRWAYIPSDLGTGSPNRGGPHIALTPEGGTFVRCDTVYAPTHTISYLWHGRECCTQNIALGTGSHAIFSRIRVIHI